jgi:hypothetical protein
MSESASVLKPSVLQVRDSRSGAPAVRAATDVCDCGHLVDAHDSIASRYCKATTFNEMSRGCICLVGAAADHPESSSS